jgi:hypothetical protein
LGVVVSARQLAIVPDMSAGMDCSRLARARSQSLPSPLRLIGAAALA